MLYNYYCEEKECTIGKYMDSKADGYTIVVKKGYKKLRDELLIWEAEHGMGETPTVLCPVCKGKANKNYAFNNTTFYFRGQWALDRSGCQREMDLHKLEGGHNQYEEWYQPGEKDEIRSKLKKDGRKEMRHKNLNNMPSVAKVVKKRTVGKTATTIKLA